jgi:hypothetical protein
MKNIKYITLSITICLLNACSDALNIAPDGSLTMEEIYTDPNKVESLLNACYNNIPQKDYKFQFWDNPITGLSDDALTFDIDMPAGLVYHDNASANWHPLMDFTDFHNGDHFQYWTRYWTQIRLCSQFLENIETAAVKSEANRQRFAAEAHVLRAYFYSELIKWFGKVPVLDHTIPFDADFSTLKRASVYEVAKFIASDCDAAINTPELPWRITEANDAMRVTKALAYTLKEKMLLYAASPLHNEGQNHWEEAYQAGKDAVTALKNNGYELYAVCTNPATFGTSRGAAFRQLICQSADYSANPRDKETIWQHKASGIFVWHIGYIGSGMDGANKCGAAPTQELIDAFDTDDGVPVLNLDKPYMDERHLQPNYNPDNTLYNPNDPYKNRDPRMYQTALMNGDVIIWNNQPVTVETFTGGRHAPSFEVSNTWYSRTGYYHQKLVTPGASAWNQINSSNWKLFRLAEVILDYAESAAEAGHLSESKEAVNAIRARVGMPSLPDNLTQAELILRVRNERRVELAWEEHRFYDLRRWQKPDGDLSETCRWVTAIVITKNADGGYTYTRTSPYSSPRGGSSNRDLLMPIPLAEASRLESITGEKWQNPGW